MKFKKEYFAEAHNAIVEAMKSEISNNSIEFINLLDEMTNNHDDFIPRCANSYVTLYEGKVNYLNKKTGEQDCVSVEEFYANRFFFDLDTLAETMFRKKHYKKFAPKSIQSAIRRYSFTLKTYEKWLAKHEQ